MHVTALMALGLASADAGLAQTTGPTSDPLRGERRLLPIDDVMIMYYPDFTTDNAFLVYGAGDQGFLGAFVPRAVTFTTPPAGASIAAGRMFALPRDTFVVAAGNLLLVTSNGVSAFEEWNQWSVPLPVGGALAAVPGTAVAPPAIAMADFTGDGYADLAAVSQSRFMQVGTAVDVTDPSKGLTWGEVQQVNSIEGGALTAGDFDGDGVPEVALASPTPGQVSYFLEIYEVDPTELSLQLVSLVTVDSSSYGLGSFLIPQVSIAAGDFDNDVSPLGLADDEIVLGASTVVPNDRRFVIQPFQVDATLQPHAVGGQVLFADVNAGCAECNQFASVAVQSARLNWTGPLEQVVLGINTLDTDGLTPWSEFQILEFDGSDQLSYDVVATHTLDRMSAGNCQSGMRGLAIGNFDHALAIPSSLEIAVLQAYNLGSEVGGTACTDTPPLFVEVFQVDPTNWSVDGPLSGPLANIAQGSDQRPIFGLVAGDFSGGSLVVGPPEIVPLSDLAQLEVVLQAPPMHLDFIQPIDSTTAELLNLSFGLPGFNTKFTETTGTTTTTSHQSTTSHSFAEKESLEDEVSLGVPDIASVSASLQASSEQTQQSVVANSTSTITTTVESITAASDLDDRLWYTQQDVDLYLYPVLCPPSPAGPDVCGTSPSYVTFSVPQSQTLYSFVPGAAVEWYQPPHQVAQALSYPWATSQLETLFPNASLDTKLEVENLPAAGPISTTFQWTGVGETTTSIGKTRSLAFDTSVSISTDANAELDIFSLGDKTKESFSFNTSTSTSTVKTTETKIEGSIGFATSVPDAADLRSGSNPDYAYDFDVLVFGQTLPSCADATATTPCLYDDTPLGEEITTQGALWAGYTVDLAAGGSWWTAPQTDYFTFHDIALNHPQRWVGDASQSTGDNCLLDSSSSTQLCYVSSPDSLQPADIWTNEFHQMKGLFVVPAVQDEGGQFLDPQGPQTAVINADGQVWLQARVHNYSFIATDKNGDGSAANANAVHVRFYAQEWDATNHVPLAGKPSVLIEEVVLDQCIPGHSADSIAKAACTNGGNDNWVLATTSQPFDPVSAGIDPGSSGTYVVFWVVAWMEDGSGALVPEVTEHGLTGAPGSLASLTAAGALSETYGNNIGFFHLPTFVCPSGVDCSNVGASGAATPDDEAAAPEVGVAEMDVPRKPVAVHAPTEVRALLEAGEVSPKSVHIALYEGDPEVDGQIFDVELVPYLRGKDTYLVRTSYRPASCGPRDIVVVAEAGGGVEAVRKAAEVNVSADPRTEIRALWSLFAAADLPRKERRAVEEDLRQAARAFRRGKVNHGFDALEDLRVHARRLHSLPGTVVAEVDARIDAFAACVFAAGGELAHTPRFRYRRR